MPLTERFSTGKFSMTENSFKWRCAFTTDNLMEAHIIQGLFAQAKIQSHLEGSALQGAIGEIPTEQAKLSLYVYEIKLHDAQQILLNYAQSQLHEDWRCIQCREINGPAFQYCWQCGKQHE
ncbi:DUF2007 domain-containing protein [Pseudoalteromonas citrea]|nr:DUF2007 domain-containing protein [Pseudoalteromonas citrea]